MVVQNHRQEYPDFRKKVLVKKSNNNMVLENTEKEGNDESDGNSTLEEVGWADTASDTDSD